MMKSFGLDIGVNSIRAIHLSQEKEKFKLLSFGKAKMPANLQSELEADQQKIAESIKKLVLDIGIKVRGVVISLSESQVYSRVVELPSLSDAELKGAIKWEAEQYIPIPIDKAVLDYQITRRTSKKEENKTMEVFLVAAPKSLIEKYIRIIKMADLQPLALETELISVCRALVHNSQKERHNLVVNIGSLSSDLAITLGGQIVFTRSVPTGGNALARAVARDLDLDISQAEEYKKSYGLDEKKLEGKVRAAIKPVFDVVVDEIKKAIIFYQEKKQIKLNNIILSGGTAKLPGLVPYLAGALGQEIQVGDPFANVVMEGDQKSQIGDDALLYTTAIGLAMKNV
jgi:type IV pilus assembly protein PilM